MIIKQFIIVHSVRRNLMNKVQEDIIRYHCKECKIPLDLVPNYAKYFIQYMETEPELTCPNCGTAIPVKRLYKKHLKDRKITLS